MRNGVTGPPTRFPVACSVIFCCVFVSASETLGRPTPHPRPAGRGGDDPVTAAVVRQWQMDADHLTRRPPAPEDTGAPPSSFGPEGITRSLDGVADAAPVVL